MAEIYRQENPIVRQVLDQLTTNKHWDSSDFSKILLALGAAGNGMSIPAYNRPESIHLQTWSPFFNKMWDETKKTGTEGGRAVLADLAAKKIIMGKSAVGTESSVGISGAKQPGREKVQELVGWIHTHPETFGGIGYAFSVADYVTLMANASGQVMVAMYGDGKALLVLKTSITPMLSRERAEIRISEVFREFMSKSGHKGVAAVEFNKMICIELGLALYRKTPESGDMFERVDVTS